MKIEGKALFRQVVPGKDGTKYVTAVDLDNGGDLKFAFDGPVSREADGLLGPGGSPAEHSFSAVVSGRTYNLAVTLHVQSWRLTSPAK